MGNQTYPPLSIDSLLFSPTELILVITGVTVCLFVILQPLLQNFWDWTKSRTKPHAEKK